MLMSNASDGGDHTPRKHRGLMPPWQPGQSGNPKGRPRGSRIKLATDYFDDLYDLWKRRGTDILERVADEHPEIIVKTVASLLPKEMLVEAQTSEITRDDIVRLLDDVRAARSTT
jgi:hypothetical protein